jgi:tricarballylate dehydrogenase
MWGAKIAGQASQIAYSIWDAKVHGLFLPPMYPPASADAIPGLAAALGLDSGAVTATVAAYNKAIVAGGVFDRSRLDGCRTEGLDPPKSNWALPIDTPPYYGIAMRPGITFTYMGVRVTDTANVARTDGSAFANVFAAGEIMSGNILSTGYLAGFGLTIGSVWGRIAGESAAAVAAAGDVASRGSARDDESASADLRGTQDAPHAEGGKGRLSTDRSTTGDTHE